GVEGFRDGMRRYFKRHEYGNTTIEDRLDDLGEGAGRDLHPWAQAWLETAALHTISARVERAGDEAGSLELRQDAPSTHPTIRPHTLDIALGRNEGGTILIDSIPASIDSATARVEEATGLTFPGLVFPNHNDHGFVKVALDERSIAFIRDNLNRIDDALLRQLIWHTLWTMVRDQQLKSTDFIELAAANVVAETDHGLVESILGRMSGAVSRYVPEDAKAEAARRMFATARGAL